MLRNIGICGVTVLLCREGKGEKKGAKAISDWLEGELKLFIKKFRGGQQFEVHFKGGPLPKVGVIQTYYLMVICDINLNNYQAYKRRCLSMGGEGRGSSRKLNKEEGSQAIYMAWMGDLQKF